MGLKEGCDRSSDNWVRLSPLTLKGRAACRSGGPSGSDGLGWLWGKLPTLRYATPWPSTMVWDAWDSV